MKKTSLLYSLIFSVLLLFSFLAGCTDKGPEEEKSVNKEIVVLSFGGSFADAQRAAYYTPFSQETGIKVVEASYNGEYGKLKAMVKSGNVSWDVVDIEASALMRGIKEDLYLPIDYTVVDKTDLLAEGVDKYAVGCDLYSVSLGFNTKAFPADGPHPKDWKDFWDINKFPGPRCMKKDPRFTLEIALMADGVPANEVYADGGLDIDRAFRSLDKIKPSIKVWWTSGHQPIQLLCDGEVALAAAFGARIWIAKHKEKKPVDLTWFQSVTDIEYWAVLKGAKKPDLSMKYISFVSRSDRQAEFSKLFPLGPVNKKAFDHLDPQFAKELNTYPNNFKDQIVLNAAWWAEHEAEVNERWNSWLVE